MTQRNATPRGERKSDHIRALLSRGGMTVKDIAAEVGCEPAYVRVVRNGRSKHDQAYQARPEIRAARLVQMKDRNKWRYHNDPSYYGGKAWRLQQGDSSNGQNGQHDGR